jgi:hypothetical protein
MYDAAKLNKTNSAVTKLNDSFSDQQDLQGISSLFDAIASCIIELENLEEEKGQTSSLYEILDLLAQKGLISKEASELASELEELSDVTGYVDELEEELVEANSMRSALLELLQDYTQEVKHRLYEN